MSNIINQLKILYNTLNKENLHLLNDIYSTNIRFIDPVQEINGLINLQAYFAHLYANLLSCRFEFLSEIVTTDSAALYWKMYFTHQRLAKQEMVTLIGHSHIQFDTKIFYHHDYFDMGELLYENLPILKHVIRKIKKVAAHA